MPDGGLAGRGGSAPVREARMRADSEREARAAPETVCSFRAVPRMYHKRSTSPRPPSRAEVSEGHHVHAIGAGVTEARSGHHHEERIGAFHIPLREPL